MSRAASNSLDAQDFEGTGEEDFDEAADEAAVEDGEAELSGEGDPEADESEDSEDEQPEEGQEESEEEDEEEAPEEETAGFRYKDPSSGNFDWKKMNKVLGGDDLEKSFKESQATITRFAQENKELKEVHLPQLQRRANVAQYFEQLVQTNPVIREAVLRDVNGGNAGGGQGGQGQQDPFAGFNPNDPALPLLRQMHQQNQEVLQWRRAQEQQVQRQQFENNFLQGLKGAREQFKSLVGKEPSEDQLKLVAEEMRKTNMLNGAVFIPNLFLKEIQDAATAKLLATRKTKKNLPRATKSGRRAPQNTGKVSRRAAFEDEWNKHMGEDD